MVANKKIYLIFIGVLGVLVVAILLLYTGFQQKRQVVAIPQERVIPGAIHQANKLKLYAIDISYPVLKQATASSILVSDNITLIEVATGQMTLFKSLFFKNLTKNTLVDKSESHLRGNYIIEREDAKIISILYTFTATSSTPSLKYTVKKAIVLDESTGKILSLGKLFLPNSSYLQKLSTLSKTYISSDAKGKLSQQQVNQIFTPEEKNFANYYITNDTLSIIDNVSTDNIEITIPFKDLYQILNPSYTYSS